MKTKTLIWILSAWILSLAVLMLTGCKTKTLVEYVEKHDTLRISKTDTLVKVKTEYSHDTLRIETEKVITVSVNGDTLKVVEWRDRWRDRYVAVHDTLKQVKTDTVYISKDSEHQQVITKKASWWSVWKWKLAAFAALCAVIVMAWVGFKDKIKKWLKR